MTTINKAYLASTYRWWQRLARFVALVVIAWGWVAPTIGAAAEPAVIPDRGAYGAPSVDKDDRAGPTPSRPPLRAERAADLLAADARAVIGIPASVRLFVGAAGLAGPGVLRVELLGREAGATGIAQPVARYEITTADRRIVRREALPGLAAAPMREETAAGTRLFAGNAATASETPTGTVAIHGVLRNLPGYLLQTANFLDQFKVWAEAGGRVVATETELVGSTVYVLRGVPGNAGTVVIKAKVRGYDLQVLHPGLVIPPDQPGVTLGGIDIDYATLRPIVRDVRLLIRSTPPTADDPGSFPNGARARVYARETGVTVDVVSVNGMAEAILPGLPTGWPMSFFAVNLDQGYHNGQLGPLVVPEDGGTQYTADLVLQ